MENLTKFILILSLLTFLFTSLHISKAVEDCIGSSGWWGACHCCDVDSMTVTIYSPSGSYSQQYTLTYDSSSGTCGSTPEVTETWKKNIGYTFCPEEGQYTAVVTAHSAGGDRNCDEYANENSNSMDIGGYNVNYDSGTDADKWCQCKTGNSNSWFSTISDGNNGNCCGDDGTNDMFEDTGEGNPACVEGEVVQSNSASSDKKYMVYNGEIYFCKGPLQESSGYSFIVDINSGSSVGACKCQSNGYWTCGYLVPIRGGRSRMVILS